MAEARERTRSGELPERVTQPPMVSCEFRHLQNAYAGEQACKEIAEERCAVLQREVKELREQLDTFMTAARLGVLLVSDPTEGASSSESTAVMSDPATVMSDSAAVTSEGTLTSEELIASLKLQLARVLESNRMKSAEILESLEENRSVKEDLAMTRCLIERLHELCDNLQGAVNIMSHHHERVENLLKEMIIFFNEN